MTMTQYIVSPWLTSVRLASTSNVSGTYFNGTANNGVGATLTVAASSLTIDSVAAAVGDRILLTAQTNTNENGIYIVDSIGTTVVLQRSADQQSIEQYKIGQYVSVGAGTANGGTAFVLVETLPSVLGISAMTWSASNATGAVSFSGAASTANALAVFSDTAGNIKAATTTVTLGQSLSVTGTVTGSTGLTATTGNITNTAGYNIESAVNGLTALAGGAQAGTALTRQINRVTTVASAADSVQLPAATVGGGGGVAL